MGDHDTKYKVEAEETCVNIYLAQISAEESKGEIINVEGGVYAEAIREFEWPEHVDAPKFHTMVSPYIMFVYHASLTALPPSPP